MNLNVVNRIKKKKYHFISSKRLKEFTAREVEMLKAHTHYEQQLEQLKYVTKAAKEELANNNKYHPLLRYTESYTLPASQSYYDALQLRISSPSIGWDDTNRIGSVKILFKNHNTTDQIGYMYAFTDALVNSARDFDQMLQRISLEITSQLITTLCEKFNPPDTSPLLYKPKEPEYNEETEYNEDPE